MNLNYLETWIPWFIRIKKIEGMQSLIKRAQRDEIEEELMTKIDKPIGCIQTIKTIVMFFFLILDWSSGQVE